MTEKDKKIQDLEIKIAELVNELTEAKLEVFRLQCELTEKELNIKESRDVSDFT